MSRIWGLALGALLVTPLAAQAQMVRADDPSTLASAMQSAGYRAELTTDDDGDPFIRSASSGTNFSIFFFGCTKNTDCTSIEFYVGFKLPDPLPVERYNKWNAENRYTRAYSTEAGAARLEMDLDLSGSGMPRELFLKNLEHWTKGLAEFDTYTD